MPSTSCLPASLVIQLSADSIRWAHGQLFRLFGTAHRPSQCSSRSTENLLLIAAFRWTTVPVRISIKIDQTARTSGENRQKIGQWPASHHGPTSVTGRPPLPAARSDQKWPLNDDGSARHGQHGEKCGEKDGRSAFLANIETSFAPKWTAAMATLGIRTGPHRQRPAD